MSVANLDADILHYSGPLDFQVYTEYISENKYNLILRNLKETSGWKENIRVLVHYKDVNKTEVFTFLPTEKQEQRKTIDTLFPLKQQAAIKPIPTYKTPKPYHLERISRSKFNSLFDAKLVTLPENMFAVGLIGNWAYIYNETYKEYHMIELTIKHILLVAVTEDLYRKFYFVICAHDGYLESHYLSETGRNKPKVIGEDEYKGKMRVLMDKENEYPVFHKDEYVLGMAIQNKVDKAIAVPDRYYFYLNHHNQYRSIHGGIPFASKINKMVFGGRREYGPKYNFINDRKTELNLRQYFHSPAVNKENVVAPDWIERHEMLKYKYVIDMDGNTSTWDATAWKLNSNSVILKVESCWRQWFYDGYLPWIHYVPVANDMSDLQEKYKWCEEHQEECEKIIENAKKLFQEVYLYQNVVNRTIRTLHTISNCTPFAEIDNRRFYFMSQGKLLQNVIYPVNYFPNMNRLNAIKYMSNKIRDQDILVLLNGDLIDFNGFTPEKLYTIWKSFDKKIVFGAERNLWPWDIECYRQQLINLTPAGTNHHFMQSGFFVAEAGEMRKILDECQVEDFSKVIDQAYFTKIMLMDRYSITLDYFSKIVFNAYRYSYEEIRQKYFTDIMFIHLNGGRFNFG
jgi:hypothetical protein